MINDYYEVFEKRSHNHGKSFKQVVQNDALINFKRFLQSSPDAINVKINGRNKPLVRVATILEKETETKNKRFFLCDKEDKITVGDFIYWDDTVWLAYMKTLDTIQAYDKFEALECKHFIKWIDQFGVINATPAFLIAQTDDKIKANFRTWNNMVTPQPNKYMEIITSRKNINLGQKFLIDNTAWHVVESDYISVKNILYLSLVEDKICDACDNIIEDIADYYVDLNKVTIEDLGNSIELATNDSFTFNNKIFLNGNEYNKAKILVRPLDNEDLIEVNENTVTARKNGFVHLQIYLDENEEVYQEIELNIVESPSTNITYILDGDNQIKWGRTKVFELIKVENGERQSIPATFEILSGEEFLNDYIIGQQSLCLTANTENKVGEVIISASTENLYFEKTISIISLWM